MEPWQVAQLGGASSPLPKGCGFDSQLGRLCEAADQCFSLPFPLALKDQFLKILGGGGAVTKLGFFLKDGGCPILADFVQGCNPFSPRFQESQDECHCVPCPIKIH